MARVKEYNHLERTMAKKIGTRRTITENLSTIRWENLINAIEQAAGGEYRNDMRVQPGDAPAIYYTYILPPGVENLLPPNRNKQNAIYYSETTKLGKNLIQISKHYGVEELLREYLLSWDDYSKNPEKIDLLLSKNK